MAGLAQDLRYAARVLAKSPVATSIMVLSLALGIGANTAIFTLLNAVLLRSLPIPHPEQLVQISTATPQNPDRELPLSLAIYQQLRKDQRVFSDLFGWNGGGIINIEANGVKYAGSVSAVTGEYFPTLGIQPLLGRFITPADPATVAVLGYGCWQSRYAGDPAIIGKTIRVEGRPLTIIGVMPENFAGLVIESADDVTVPIGYSGQTDRLSFDVYARLKPAITIEQARTQIEGIWPAIRLAALPGNDSRRIGVTSAATGKAFLRVLYARPLSVLMAMVGLLLLIACVNLANLMLARAANRRREFTVRLALGAAKWRIVRLLLTESLLLSLAGAALGIVMAHWASHLLVNTMSPGRVPLAINISPDTRVLAFTVGISVLTGIVFGLAPARGISRIDPTVMTVRGASTGTMAKLLIAAQVAISLVLVIGAVLFVRSLQNLRSADLGFRREGVAILQLFPRLGAEGQPMPGRVAYYHELADRLAQLAGVESVSYSHMGPSLSYEYKEPASVSGSRAASVQAVFEAVGPGFFRLAGMHVLAGREFDWRDDEGAKPLAIISASLARRLFPSENPIGKIIDFGPRRGLEVAGVVNNASLWLPQSREPMAVYFALMQQPTFNSSSVLIRTGGNPEMIIPGARRELAAMGRHVALRAQTLDQRASLFLAPERIVAMLSSFFGGLALLLVSIGLYGLMSYSVARRTSEIGVRMALGARPAAVFALIARDVVRLVLAGIIIGIPSAIAASRLIAGMIHSVSVTDPLILIFASAILLAVALLAGLVPARRASRISPMTALRTE